MAEVEKAQVPDRACRGKAGVDGLLRGVVQSGPPIVFLDFDDVLCVGRPYNGFDVLQPEEDRPADLYERLWSPEAVSVLRRVVECHRPRVVLTTSWLRVLARAQIVEILERTTLKFVAPVLHSSGDAVATGDETRHASIIRWLHRYYDGTPVVVLDDHISGSGLARSPLMQAGRVVLCEPRVGLVSSHVPAIERALAQP